METLVVEPAQQADDLHRRKVTAAAIHTARVSAGLNKRLANK
jgi:hypothetical protein